MNRIQKRTLIISMITAFTLLFSPTATAYQNNAKEELRIIEDAGSHGCYSYDTRTKVSTYVPVTEYAPVSSTEDYSVKEEKASLEVLENEYTEYFEDDVTQRPDIQNDDTAHAQGIEPFIIIGSDDRQSVSSVTSQYTNTCLIVARYSNGRKDFCTGFTLDNYYVLTAGHIAYRHDWGYATHFAIYAGANAGTYKKYSLAYRCDIGADYVNNSYGDAYDGAGMEDDWAILKCETPLGVGRLGRVTTNSASEMLSYTYYTQGYPFDKNIAEFGENPDLENLIQYRMYKTSGKVIKDVGSSLVTINMDTATGQSGSPIYRYHKDHGYVAQAMIVASNSYYQSNYALLLNNYLCGKINKAAK